MNHPNRKKIFPDHTLENKLRADHHAAVVCLWEIPGPKNTHIAWIAMYSVTLPTKSPRPLIVYTYKEEGTWDAFTANESGDVADTVADVIERCSRDPR